MTGFAKQDHSYYLAVTGSIASGKTHACSLMKELARQLHLELEVVNVDLLRAEILEDRNSPTAQQVQNNLIEYFGTEIVSSTGSINRRRLSDITFSDHEAMCYLDSILDPVLIEAVNTRLRKSSSIVLVEWALIAEKQQLALTNHNVLLVSCSIKKQLNRLSGGDLPQVQIRNRITSQYSTEEKRNRILAARENHNQGDFYELKTDGDPGISIYRDLLLTIVNKGGPPHERHHFCRV